MVRRAVYKLRNRRKQVVHRETAGETRGSFGALTALEEATSTKREISARGARAASLLRWLRPLSSRRRSRDRRGRHSPPNATPPDDVRTTDIRGRSIDYLLLVFMRHVSLRLELLTLNYDDDAHERKNPLLEYQNTTIILSDYEASKINLNCHSVLVVLRALSLKGRFLTLR